MHERRKSQNELEIKWGYPNAAVSYEDVVGVESPNQAKFNSIRLVIFGNYPFVPQNHLSDFFGLYHIETGCFNGKHSLSSSHPNISS